MSDRDTITLPREVVQEALRRAFHLGQNYWYEANRDSGAAHKRADKYRQDFDALCSDVLARTALAAEPTKQEPVAWMDRFGSVVLGKGPYETFTTPLYTAPPDAEALRRDAEQGRWLREWLDNNGLLVRAIRGESLAGYEHPDIEALRRDAERYKWVLNWLWRYGLLSREKTRIDTPESYGDWFVLRKPHIIDGGSLIGYGKTEDAAIDAAMKEGT